MSPTLPPSPTLAAIVVAGGAARRMGGVDKLALEVAGRPLLDRVLEAAAEVCDVVVVVGPGRPTGVAGVLMTTEPEPGGGPVPAVAAGLAIVPEATAVVVLAADLALLTAHHVRLLVAGLGDVAACAALDERGPNPLLAAHEAGGLRERIAALGPDRAGVAAARLLPSDAVTVDLGSDAVLNVNRQEDLERARVIAGRPP